MNMRYVEETIDQLTYPAKLPPASRRLLAAKYHEIDTAIRERRDELSRQLDSLRGEKTVNAVDLPKAAKALVAKLTKLETDVQLAKLALQNMGVTKYGAQYYVKQDKEELVRQRDALQTELNSLEERRKSEVAALKLIAEDLAKVEVSLLKARIEKANPELVARLNTIGQKALPPATEVIQGQKLVGKGSTRSRKMVEEAEAIAKGIRKTDLPSLLKGVRQLQEIEDRLQGADVAEARAAVQAISNKLKVAVMGVM